MSRLPKPIVDAAMKAIAASGEFNAVGRFEVEDGALTKIAEAISPSPRGHFLDHIKDAVETLKAEREGPQQLVARIKKSSKYAYQAPDEKWFGVRFSKHDDYCVNGNGNQYRRSDVVFEVRLDDGRILELK